MMMSACHLRVEDLPVFSSMTFSARTTEGTQTYACDEGVWMKVGSSAKLVNSRGGKLGFFQSAYDCKKRHSNMRWTLYNSAGDQAESGFATSSISGTPHILQSPLSQIDVAPKPFTRHSEISFGFPDCFYELKIDQSVLFRHNPHGLVPLTASMFSTLIHRFRSDVSFKVSWPASMW